MYSSKTSNSKFLAVASTSHGSWVYSGDNRPSSKVKKKGGGDTLTNKLKKQAESELNW